MKIFYLPDLGEGLAEAEIREWYVNVGDLVKVDQPLVSMETAKAVVDVPSPYAGKIMALHGKENEIIQTGAPFITFETDEKNADQGSVVGKLETSGKQWQDDEVIIGAAKTTTTAVKAMPAARAFAKEMNIDLHQVTPSGPQGLITIDDVKKYLEQHAVKVDLGETKEVLHGVRRVMAQTMVRSHLEIVPVTIFDEVDITDFPAKTDITVLLLQAMMKAAQQEKSLNVWFDGKTLERKLFDEVNIGLAVDNEEGLFVPVIKNIAQHSAASLREKINQYKEAIRTRSIAGADMQGATMTLSNFGMIAGRYATPIIVPPAVAILGCGRITQAVLPRGDKMIIGKIMPLSLSFDHRAVTGGEATRYLGAVIQHLQNSK